ENPSFFRPTQHNLRLYINQAAGGISEVRNYEGKSMRQAADLMRQFDSAQVWMEPKKREHNL
ncbi:MAG TPA: hypothetical protein PKH33_14095, partial [bacterium]|nr:hypothetical protein [bacterium]